MDTLSLIYHFSFPKTTNQQIINVALANVISYLRQAVVSWQQDYHFYLVTSVEGLRRQGNLTRRLICNYSTVCLPVCGKNQRALASEFPPIQVCKLWYNYFVPPLSVLTLLSMKYFVLNFVISCKSVLSYFCL